MAPAHVRSIDCRPRRWRATGMGSATVAPVRASRISMSNGPSKTGSYAWRIADESQKCRLDLNEDGLKLPAVANNIVSAQIIDSHTGRPGIGKMTGMGAFDPKPESLEKMITTGQAGISVDQAAKHFRDLTACSLGLLTDVRAGGFKSDLNLPLESYSLPQEMRETKLFSGRLFDVPIRPMTGELERASIARVFRLYRSRRNNPHANP